MPSRKNFVIEFEKKLGFAFKNKNLLIEAFVHRSYLNEHPNEDLIANERLEFLGDTVLEFLTSRFLFQKFPNFSEGELTNLRSKLVCTRSLAKIAKKLDLSFYLLLSRGEEESGGRENASLLANTFEALLGAIYLDQGIDQTQDFLQLHLFPTIEKAKEYQDYKSNFQRICQEKFKITPVYKTLEESGPDHAKTFTEGVYIDKKLWGRGEGKSKQEAEQEAAKKALDKLDKILPFRPTLKVD